MDELKSKILGLLNKQSPKIPSMGFSDENYHFPKTESLCINSKTAPEENRPSDQEILESIEAAYFAPDNFDICRFELKKLPEKLDCDRIQADFKLLKRQHQVVSKKVLQLILEHQNACGDEFKEMLALCEKLDETATLCRDGRAKLHVAERQVASTLGVIANYRKRKCAQHLLNNLQTIKSLYRTDFKLHELLKEENYAGAIELILECQASAQTYKHFKCVAALTNKLQETLEYTEEQLDRVLAQMCYFFDAKRYGKLQDAYKLLGKTQIAVDHLHMHYISAIYNTSVNIVYVYVQQHDGEVLSINADSKKPYKNLCLSVNQENFIPCLLDLCKSLFKIVLSYRNLVKWHSTFDITSSSMSPSESDIEGGIATDIEENFNKEYIKQKLEHNLQKIWQDVQSKVSSLLMNSDLGMYKFDQFVQVLNVVHRLIEVGDEFCGSKSEELHESIRKQSVNYFEHYHAQRLEELKIFLENESWTVCPVKASFDILQLQEFKAMKHVLRNFKRTGGQYFNNSNISNDCSSSSHSQDGSTVTGNYFIRFSEHGTPFDFTLDDTIEEDILLSENEYFSEDSDEENEELRKDFIDEYAENETKKTLEIMRREKHVKTHILTNTTLSVLRQMGKYLQMSRLLKPIAFDIIKCMNQLFDFYLYAVHVFFAADLTVSSTNLYSLSLSSTLKRIQESLFQDLQDSQEVGTTLRVHSSNFLRVHKPTLSPLVDLKKVESLHGLAERVVGVESLIFLARQYESLQGYLESLVPPQSKSILQQFFNQTISSAIDLRRPVYMTVCAQAFDLRQILSSMIKISWDVNEVMSQHNNYIDVILREIQIFTMRLEQINTQVHINEAIISSLWENIAHIITHTLVQGFSEAKKCTPCGRALMRLDFTHFLQTFEQISKVRPIPHKDYVDTYINAFYIPEQELDDWMRSHPEYSSKHLYGLVSCVCNKNKKSKQRLFGVIEEIERGQR